MKSPRIVQLAMFAMAVCGGVETASADPTYSFTAITVPGAVTSTAFGINDSGQIVGSFNDGSGFQGFVDTGGSFTTIDVPGAVQTYAYGINNSGQIVGYFQDTTTDHGYLDTGGNFTTIDVPGEIATEALGINDSGQIVGSFYNGSSNQAFLATPVPEPSNALTLATGLVALLAMVYRRKRASSP
jgi:probable HAF family extracellular repeat protein